MKNRTSIGVYRARAASDGCVILERDTCGTGEWQPVCHMSALVADALGRELQQMAQDSARRARVSYVNADGAAVAVPT